MPAGAEMTLSGLLGKCCPKAQADTTISGICLDSSRIAPGDLFVALQGQHRNGLDFVADATERGAVAVLADRNNPGLATASAADIIAIDDLASRLAEIAARFYGQPAARLHLVGVTGTNGKTSCAWLYANWRALTGSRCGVLGTLGCGEVGATGAWLDDPGLTTPDVIDLQRLLAKIAERGCRHAVLEVSSHALDQQRIAGVTFRSAIFTNLSRDHLDYHGDMQQYSAAKRKLFEVPGLELAVINMDDPAGRDIHASLPVGMRKLGYSLQDTGADIYAGNLRCDTSGSRASVSTPAGEGELHITLPGNFNISNALAVLSTLLDEGVPLQDLLEAAPRLMPVPGRMQRVTLPNGQPEQLAFAVFIDYAHTPDALQNALGALKPHARGMLRVVFGAGGNRDRGKRPLMGAVAAAAADQVILTSDNPRDEVPQAIIGEIRAGIDAVVDVVEEVDRQRAIHFAVNAAGPGDIVLIAGKGHERYQERNGQRITFDDYAVAEAALQERCAA